MWRGRPEVNARVNVPRILQAMKQNGWGLAATAVNVGVNNKTLAKILNGEVPRRLDAFYRVLDGLKIPIQEAILDGRTHKVSQGPLRLVSGRRHPNQVA